MEIAELQLRVSDRDVRVADGSVRSLEASWTRAQAKVVTFNQAMDLGGRIIRGVAIATRMAVQPAIDYETAWAGVVKTVNASERELAGLQARLDTLNARLPASTAEVLAVAEAAGQLGIHTANIEGFTDVMVKLGVTTNLSAQDAATQLARLANITGLNQSEFDRLGSTVVALGNNMATTEAEIVAMALRIAGAGSSIGLSESQIVSYAATLSSLGIEAEAGGTAISRIFIEIAKAVETGGSSLHTFAQVSGSSAAEFAAAFRTNAATATQQFIRGLADIEEQGGSTIAVLEELGLDDIRVGDALRRAAGGGQLLADALDLGANAWRENNALTKEADQRFATTASQLTLLAKDIEDLAVRFGSELLPNLKETITETRELVNLFDSGAELAGGAFALGLQSLNNYLASMKALLEGIRDVTPDLTWLFDDSPGASEWRADKRDDLTIDVGGYNTREGAAGVSTRDQRAARARAAILARQQERDLRAAEDPFAYGQTPAGGFGGNLGEGEGAWHPSLEGFGDKGWTYDYAMPSSAPEPGTVGPPIPDGHEMPDAKEAQRAADLARQVAERNAAGSASARVLEADSVVTAAQAELSLYQQRIELAANLAETDQARSAITLASEQQQLALAQEIDRAERSRINARIAALQVERERSGLTAGELEALNAETAELEQQLVLLDESGGKAREIADEFARSRAELRASNEEQARALREQVRPLEAVARRMAEIRELAKQPGASGLLTPDVIDDLERGMRDDALGSGNGFDELLQATEGFGRDFSRTFAEATAGARVSWQDLLQGMLTDLNEMLIHRGLTEPVFGFVEGALLDPLQEKVGGGRDGRTLGREAGQSMWSGASDAIDSEEVVKFVRGDVGEFFGGMPDMVGGWDDGAERAGDAFVAAAEDFGDRQAGILDGLQSGLTGVMGGLQDFAFNLLSPSGDGFSIGGLFAAIGIGAVKGAIGGATGGGGTGGGELVGPPQADGTFHDGGVVGQFYHRGGLRRGEVPAVLEEGELVVDRDTTSALYDLFSRRGEVRRYHDGGVVGRDDPGPLDAVRDAVQQPRGGGGGRGPRRGGDGVTVNVNVSMSSQSFDPATGAQLLMQHAETIETIVERGARRGAGLSRALGLRDRGQ